jgi:hypothetical protein
MATPSNKSTRPKLRGTTSPLASQTGCSSVVGSGPGGDWMTRDAFLAAREPADPNETLPPDWLVTHAIDKGPSEYYRYHTRGINLSVAPGEHGREFSWAVPRLSWRYFLADE